MANGETPTSTDDTGFTKPTDHHVKLHRLLGEWRSDSEMIMGPDESIHAKGYEKITKYGDLFVVSNGWMEMPDGKMEYTQYFGFDVTFGEYRSVMLMNASSHIWNYKGVLSEDGTRLTMTCQGPNMDPNFKEGDPLTILYRDTLTFESDDARTTTTEVQLPDGEFMLVMKGRLERI